MKRDGGRVLTEKFLGIHSVNRLGSTHAVLFALNENGHEFLSFVVSHSNPSAMLLDTDKEQRSS